MQAVYFGPIQGVLPDTVTSSAVTLPEVKASMVSSSIGTTATVLQTAKVSVMTPFGPVTATVLFDSAAD